MAQFEEKYPIDAFRVYRPTVSTKENAKAWWRYAILAEVYKVRCKQREELWRVAGNKGLNILSHIRFIIAEKGNMDNMDDEEVNENYVTETVRKLKNLQNTVSDLNRDNMVLRKMLKTLFTPLAVENFASDEITLQDIEQEIAIFESRALTASKRLTFEDIDQPSQSFDCDSQCEGIMESGKAADFEVLESLASSVGTPDLNIRSPYENLLPPIDIQDTKVVPKKNNKAGSPKSPRLKAVRPKDKLFPSYLEREAMRKENAAKKKERANLVKAERIMKAMLEKEEAGAAAVNGNIKATPTVSGEASVTTTSDALIPPKQGKIVHKPLLQPQWVDDFKMPDLMFGRGKGKPKEDPPPLQFQLKGISNDSTAVNSHSSAGPHQPAPPKMLPKATENMSSGQKVAVELIAKARNKALSPEEAVKPLSKIEMNLLKSPLALPVAKFLPGATVLSPRERSMRSNASPRVNSFNYAPKKKDSPRAAKGDETGPVAPGNEPVIITDNAVALSSSSNGDNGVVTGNGSGSNGCHNLSPVDSARKDCVTTASAVAALPFKKSPHERSSPREAQPKTMTDKNKAATVKAIPSAGQLRSLSQRLKPSNNTSSASAAAVGPGGSKSSSSSSSSSSTNKSGGDMHDVPLTSQSAPASVASSRHNAPAAVTSPAPNSHTPVKLELQDETEECGDRSRSCSPRSNNSPDSTTSKLLKKNILKSLNEKSNPASPRQPESPQQPFGKPADCAERSDSAGRHNNTKSRDISKRPDSPDEPEDSLTVRPGIDFAELDTLVASISTTSLDAAVVV